MKGNKIEYDVLNNRGGVAFYHRGHPQEPEILYHDFISIAYVAHGEGFHIVDGDRTEAHEGDIFIVNPDTPHSFISSERNTFIEIYYCIFLPEMHKRLWSSLREDFGDLSPFFDNSIKFLKVKDNENRRLRNLMVYAIDEFMHCPPGNRHTIESYFTLLLTLCLRQSQNAINNPVFNKNKTVDEIIRYINYNLNFGITISDIADAHHLSEAYLCRLFKKFTGQTLTQFINNLKIDKAKDLLQNTDRSLESISDTLNCNTVYLQRIFKKHTGLTMREYREKYHYKN